MILIRRVFQDTFRRNLRRTIMRYINLSFVLVFRLVSRKVHDRFPSYQSLLDAKLILKQASKNKKSM